MITVHSLTELEQKLAVEKISGVVRLAPADERESAGAWTEASRLQSEFPAVPFFFVKAILGDQTAEDAAGELLREFGHGNALFLPHYWIVWRGAIPAIYKQSGMIMRDLLSMFGGKDAVESVAQWIEDQLKVERGTGKPKERTKPKQKKREDRPTRDRVNPPHVVLGVRADADETTIRSAYRKLCAQYHPDKYAQADKREQDQANRRMTEINAAYESLKRAGRVK